MTKINVGKVVMGGLLAGLVMNAIDFLTNTYWLAANWTAMGQARNLNPAAMQSTEVMLKYVLIDFAFGLVAVWVYAAMRPRFGPGPRTAAIAAVTLWVATCLAVGQFQIIGMFTFAFYVQGCIAALCSTLPGTIAGAWAYSE
jgi:hypothetical protein